MADLEPLLRFWRALDALFEGTVETPWGGIVADPRYPAVQETNYARVESTEPVTLFEIEDPLLPALARSGCRREHVVVFRPESQTGLLAQASMRGDRLTWDLVMVHDEGAPPADVARVVEVRTFDDAFWRAHRDSIRLFDVADEAMLDQLQALERDVLVPAGRRWFVVPGAAGRPEAFSALLVLRGVAFVDHVATLPEVRRRGHATALAGRLLAEARDAGARRTYLLAEPGGVAERIYRGLGFRPVTRIASWIAPLDGQGAPGGGT